MTGSTFLSLEVAGKRVELTAKALGLTLQSALLLRADKVIEQ